MTVHLWGKSWPIKRKQSSLGKKAKINLQKSCIHLFFLWLCIFFSIWKHFYETITGVTSKTKNESNTRILCKLVAVQHKDWTQGQCQWQTTYSDIAKYFTGEKRKKEQIRDGAAITKSKQSAKILKTSFKKGLERLFKGFNSIHRS